MNKPRRTGEQYYAEIKKIAEDNGGILLSEKWINSKIKYKFAFSKNDITETFERNPYDLIRHGWPKDKEKYLKKSRGMVQIHSISDNERYIRLKNIIEINGGKIITDKWHGYKKQYDIIDEFGIEQKIHADRVFNNHWISNRGQVAQPICKQIFEHLFKEKFIQTKKVLTAKILNRNRPFELDGYCEKLKIAFEYQGDPSHWDVSHEKYPIVSERDQIKKQVCEQLGIKLIQIPAFIDNKYKWSNEYLFNHVKEAIIETFNFYNKKPPHLNNAVFQVNHKDIYKFHAIFKEMEEIAMANNAQLITKEITQYKIKLMFKTDDGIEFQIPLKTIRSKGWPKDIAIHIKKSEMRSKSTDDFLNEMDTLAKKNGARLISTTWTNCADSYIFETDEYIKIKINRKTLRKSGWPKNINRHIIKE
jgi:hypothetical protein